MTVNRIGVLCDDGASSRSALIAEIMSRDRGGDRHKTSPNAGFVINAGRWSVPLVG